MSINGEFISGTRMEQIGRSLFYRNWTLFYVSVCLFISHVSWASAETMHDGKLWPVTFSARTLFLLKTNLSFSIPFKPEILTCLCLGSLLFRVTLEISRVECNIDVTPATLTATDTCIGHHVTRFEASRKVILNTRYVCACVGVGCGRSRGIKIKTNVIIYTRYVSTCVGAGGGRGRGTKIKTKANRCGPCYLTCDMYKSSLRHIHDPVLSSLKMKGTRLIFFYVGIRSL
jgi:hypothetical protein